jgi:hypothetical protein
MQKILDNETFLFQCRSPFFLYFNAQLLKLQLLPILAYANNETSVPYGYPWAPHHLGFYPIGYILDSQQGLKE